MNGKALFRGFVALKLALALALTSCLPGKDSGNGQDVPDVTGDEATATNVMSKAVLPMIETVNLQTYAALLEAGGIPTTSSQCDPLELCSSGEAQLCAGLEGVEVRFTNCGALNTTVSGSIRFLGNATEGSAILSLDLNDTDIAGSATYSVSEECFVQFFNDVTIKLPDLTMVMQGIMEYCNPTTQNGIVVPSFAELLFSLPDVGRNVQVTIYSEEGAGNYSVHVTDATQSNVLLACNGNLFGGISCHPIETGLGL